MNLGVYIPQLGPNELNNNLFTVLNSYVEQGTFEDVSLFYDDINFCPIDPKFGIFNTHNLWNFTGTLFCFGMDVIPKIDKTVNKFKTVVVYDDRKNILNILKAMEKYNVVATDETQCEYLARVTGKEVSMLNNFDFENCAGLAR